MNNIPLYIHTISIHPLTRHIGVNYMTPFSLHSLFETSTRLTLKLLPIFSIVQLFQPPYFPFLSSGITMWQTTGKLSGVKWWHFIFCFDSGLTRLCSCPVLGHPGGGLGEALLPRSFSFCVALCSGGSPLGPYLPHSSLDFLLIWQLRTF